MRVGAGAIAVSGVPHFVTDAETVDLRSDCAHDGCSVKPQHARMRERSSPLTQFDVDGVDRDGLDLNEQVVRARLRHWQVNVNETFGIGDRQGPGDGDGVHAFHDPTVVPIGCY